METVVEQSPTVLDSRGPAWRDWVINNLKRGCLPATMLQSMLRAGWRSDQAAEALDLACHMLGRPASWRPPRPDIQGSANFVDAGDRRVALLMTMESPRVVLLEGLLSAEECAEFAARAEGKGLRGSAVVDRESGASVGHDARTSSGCFFTRGENALVSRIEARIACLTNWPLDHAEGLQVLRYGVGQEYRPHYDWFNPDNSGSATHLTRGGQRVGTTVIYLSDTEAGGATVFPSIGLEVRPRRGCALFFADVDLAGQPDEKTLHGGGPVLSGVKLIATCWQRQAPFRA